MTISRSIILALISGSVLSAFVVVTCLVRFDLSIWLAVHNSIVVATFVVCGYVGYRSVELGVGRAAVNIGAYYLILMAMYIGTYILLTSAFVDSLDWIPFWERDFSYHGFGSVREYMDHKTNFLDLLVLQVISCGICSILYFSAGLIGFGAGKFILGRRHALQSEI